VVEKRMKHPSKLVNVGDEVDCVVLSVNRRAPDISLGMRQLRPTLDTCTQNPVGARSKAGAQSHRVWRFIEIEDGIDGLVHVSNLADHSRKASLRVLKKGDKVKASSSPLNRQAAFPLA